ncbi:sensor histidine kinase [Novosphingobium profundi]|uniref:sensor histidine kinase n=1 Tax=Novosphingobium profundi TaxID=1774954 RepID=UPI001BDABE7C
MDQLHHTGWTLRDGAPGNIRALAQGPDGFLWLGTSTGLYRFDGVHFERIRPDQEDRGRSLQVTALLAARNGEIWVGYDFGGIGIYREGHLRDANPWPPEGGVAAIVQARDGSIWVASEVRGAMQLARRKAGRWTRFDSSRGLVDGLMGPVLATREGLIYAALPPSLLHVELGGSRLVRTAETVESFAALAQDHDGTIWLADDAGLRRLDGKGALARLGHVGTPYITRHMLIDRDGGIWITGQDNGLVRYRKRKGRLTGETPHAMTSKLSLSALEDREGNVWVGTATGLDRFAPATMMAAKGAPEPVTGFVSDPRSPYVFFAGTAGVYRISHRDGVPHLVFAQRDIGVLCGSPERMLAISLEGATLLELDRGGTVKKLRKIAGPLSVSCAQDKNGTFWTGMDRLYRVGENRLIEAGPPGGTITLLRADPKGGLLAARSRTGLLIRDARGTRLRVPGKVLTIGTITTLTPAREGLLLGGQKGLALVANGTIAQLSERMYPFLAGLTGVLQTGDGWTWMIGATGVVRVKDEALAKAFRKPGTPIAFQSIGQESDYRARSNVFESNDIARDASGTLWFVTDRGIGWVEPSRLVRNRIVPPVSILSLNADGRGYPLSGTEPVRLPPNIGRVEIRYTALSLTDAATNQFRYRLAGGDGTWYDAGMGRQALFTNLGPGRYELQVIAANNAGVWNSEGARLSFEVAPAFYQSSWFLICCAVLVMAAIWLFYRRRLAIITERARSRVEVQLAERERIARELHDTLLQGFQGLMLRFQAVVELLPRGDKARAEMESALDRADSVLLESRERVHSMRQDLLPVELAERLSRLADDILPSTIAWDLETTGLARLICAPVADEVIIIMREALSNTVRHAQASHVALRIRYSSDEVIVSIGDDGKGLPRTVLEAGAREGHYGLVGMRERARKLSGALDISTSGQGGTAITFAIPADIAYRTL